MALTSAMEDYLEAILMIKQQHGYVRCVDVAEQLGVKKPSVSRAVKELIKSGHLVKNADGTLSLTELGLPSRFTKSTCFSQSNLYWLAWIPKPQSRMLAVLNTQLVQNRFKN